MAMEKVSVSLSPEALAVIDAYASQQGITRSAWIEQAAAKARRQEAISRALEQYEQESGQAFTAREMEVARRRVYGEPGKAE